jgi:hypothetical protein
MSKIENLFHVLPSFKFQRIHTADADSKFASVLSLTLRTDRSPSVDMEKSLPPFCIEKKFLIKELLSAGFLWR